MPSAYLDERSGDDPDHVVKEARAFDNNMHLDTIGVRLLDSAISDCADGGLSAVACGCETGEIVGADESAGGQVHQFDIHGNPAVPDVMALIQWSAG